MANIIQVNVSDKDLESIDVFIEQKTLTDYSGNYLTKRSAVCAYLINLGIRVIKSKNDKDIFDISNYRYEMLKKVLQNVQLTKSIIAMLNELPEFKDRNLLDEFFNKNSSSIEWIDTEIKKFFNKDE